MCAVATPIVEISPPPLTKTPFGSPKISFHQMAPTFEHLMFVVSLCFLLPTSRNRKRCRQTGSGQSTPVSTIRTRYGNSVSTPGATRTGKNKQNSLQKEADTEFQYRPHIIDTDTDCGRHFCGRHFRGSQCKHPSDVHGNPLQGIAAMKDHQ